MNQKVLVPVPSEPVCHWCRPEVYQAFANLISEPSVRGIGGNVRDPEILRLACLEKIRRDGPDAIHDPEAGFQLHFLANLCPAWARDRVLFWDEGLGYGWNLLVFDPPAGVLLKSVQFHGTRPFTFALSSLPARLPEAICEIHEDYAICRRDPTAPPLTPHERELWDKEGRRVFDEPQPYKWPDEHGGEK